LEAKQIQQLRHSRSGNACCLPVIVRRSLLCNRVDLLPLLAPPSLTVPVVAGHLALGTWQSICLLDPNPDNALRTVRLSFLPG